MKPETLRGSTYMLVADKSKYIKRMKTMNNMNNNSMSNVSLYVCLFLYIVSLLL